jgi:hypothetical protein
VAAAQPVLPKNRFISIARHTTMTDALRLTLKQDADGTGELCAEVQVNGFSGVGAAWFNIAEIRDFGQRISRTYPLLPEQTYELQGGYWSRGLQGSLEQVHLGIRFFPVGALGQIGCRVNLARQLESASPAPEYAVTVELRTHYEGLRAFGGAIVAMTDGRSDEAVLACSGA